MWINTGNSRYRYSETVKQRRVEMSSSITSLPVYRSREQVSTYGRTVKALLVAGLAGGIAEIVWIAFYSQYSPLSLSEVSRQIVLSMIPAVADAGVAPLIGVAIHLALSVLLAFAFGILVWLPVL